MKVIFSEDSFYQFSQILSHKFLVLIILLFLIFEYIHIKLSLKYYKKKLQFNKISNYLIATFFFGVSLLTIIYLIWSTITLNFYSLFAFIVLFWIYYYLITIISIVNYSVKNVFIFKNKFFLYFTFSFILIIVTAMITHSHIDGISSSIINRGLPLPIFKGISIGLNLYEYSISYFNLLINFIFFFAISFIYLKIISRNK